MGRNLAIALLLTACRGNYVVLTSSDEPTRETLSDLRRELNQVLGCEVVSDRFVQGEKDASGNPVFRRSVPVERDSRKLREYSEPGKPLAGAYHITRDEIVYLESLGDPEDSSMRFAVLAHELGHALGLGHHHGTIMTEELVSRKSGRGRVKTLTVLADGVVMSRDEVVSSLGRLVNEHGLNPCRNYEESR